MQASKKYAHVVAAFHEKGFAVARGALPESFVTAYRNGAAAWFEQLDGRVACGEQNPFLKVFSMQSGMSLSMRIEDTTRPPHNIRTFLGHLYSGGLWQAGFFDEELGGLIDACSIRRQIPDASDRALGYHQDAAVIDSPDGLVFWIPLDPIDDHTPGLEVIPNWKRPVLPHTTNQRNNYLETTEPITQNGVIVSMQRGDVLVFKLPTPHRTYLTPRMTKTRFSIDLRAVPLSKIPISYLGDIIVPH